MLNCFLPCLRFCLQACRKFCGSRFSSWNDFVLLSLFLGVKHCPAASVNDLGRPVSRESRNAPRNTWPRQLRIMEQQRAPIFLISPLELKPIRGTTNRPIPRSGLVIIYNYLSVSLSLSPQLPVMCWRAVSVQVDHGCSKQFLRFTSCDSFFLNRCIAPIDSLTHLNAMKASEQLRNWDFAGYHITRHNTMKNTKIFGFYPLFI